jgi:RNA polymerase sigma-70 factor (ECF subfamily)
MYATAIESIYREHGHSVLRRARVLMGNDDDARELLQEVFMSLLNRPEQFAGRSEITTWLYSATTHGCLNRIRNDRTRRRLVDERAAVLVEASTDDPERHALLRQLLVRLPSELAEVAVYRYLDGMTHEEIASALGCSRRHIGDLLERLHALASAEPLS